MTHKMVIKVCGLAYIDNMRMVDNIGVDLIGMIFYPKSPRYIIDKISDKKDFFDNIDRLRAKKTGVFVNDSIDNIEKIAKKFHLDYLQLHGSETPEFCKELNEKGFKLIKALNIKSEDDFAKCDAYKGLVDYFVFDTPCMEYGGSGKKFNWSLLEAYRLDTPFLLSGGIGSEDSESIYEVSNSACSGVDLNSR